MFHDFFDSPPHIHSHTRLKAPRVAFIITPVSLLLTCVYLNPFRTSELGSVSSHPVVLIVLRFFSLPEPKPPATPFIMKY